MGNNDKFFVGERTVTLFTLAFIIIVAFLGFCIRWPLYSMTGKVEWIPFFVVGGSIPILFYLAKSPMFFSKILLLNGPIWLRIFLVIPFVIMGRVIYLAIYGAPNHPAPDDNNSTVSQTKSPH